jgi:ATP phosphoribosyltransferase
VVATRRDFDYAAAVRRGARSGSRPSTSRPRPFRGEGNPCRPDPAVRLDGARAAGGARDAIVDLVSTGNTLKANDLVAVEQILPISARLIVNPAALKLKREAMQPLLEAISAAVKSDA